MQYESWSPLPCSQWNTDGWVSQWFQYLFTGRNNNFSNVLEDVFECLTAILTPFSLKWTVFLSCDFSYYYYYERYIVSCKGWAF
jgi:hypothetical protein